MLRRFNERCAEIYDTTGFPIRFAMGVLAIAVISLATIGIGLVRADPYIQAHGGAAVTNTELSAFGTTIDGLGAEGALAGAAVGVRTRMGQVRLAVEAYADWMANVTSKAFGCEVGPEYAIGIKGKAGSAVNEKTNIYVTAGYGQFRDISVECGGGSFSLDDLTYWSFGGEFETRLSEGFDAFLSVDYIESEGDTVGPISYKPSGVIAKIGGRLSLDFSGAASGSSYPAK